MGFLEKGSVESTHLLTVKRDTHCSHIAKGEDVW